MIELMVLSAFVIALGLISAKLYRRRRDVLYGPYIRRGRINERSA
ncbi:hypothetical protein FBZ93_1382 [Bradyrhizobium macuxiense]|uniref:Uncharacterized protein n=1 Tax=Bradyrhizobium macuxiense TaxID=1755647 RepID=A0A560KPT5_9BRAD|nr:hypothetical protein FBZ93_1382 [Bradyrhizobium macuxiense]